MAPEVIVGRGYTASADIWSLGVMLYEFVCGCLPFGDGLIIEDGILDAVLANDLKLPVHKVDPASMDLIQKLLVKRSKRRLGSGWRGWDDIKQHEFFGESSAGESASLGASGGNELF